VARPTRNLVRRLIPEPPAATASASLERPELLVARASLPKDALDGAGRQFALARHNH